MDQKNIQPEYLILLSTIGFAGALSIHLMNVLQLYQAGNVLILPLTGGMLLVWLGVSRILRLIQERRKTEHPWKIAFSAIPAWLKYVTYFFIIYAVINFILSVSPQNTSGWVQMEVSASKLRGLSGFWMAFYVLGTAAGYAGRSLRISDPSIRDDH